MRKINTPKWFLWVLFGYFVALFIGGGAAVLGALLPSDDCTLFLEKVGNVFVAKCSPPDGGSCGQGYNCVRKKRTGSYEGEEGYAYWCVCQNGDETRVPRTPCREDVLLSFDGEKVIHINCRKNYCPNPCYKLNPADMNNGDVLPVCRCPE